MRLVFINSFPTSRIFGEKIDAWWYQHHGFDVEFWDISPIFWSQERLEKYYGGADDYRYVGPNHTHFSSEQEVLEAIRGLGGRVVIWHLAWNLSGVSRADRWVLDAIVDAGIPYFIKQFETDPVSKGVAGLEQWLRAQLVRLGFRGKQPAGYIGCGSVARQRAGQILPGAAFISIPSPKVLWEQTAPLVEMPYAIFVDENVEYAPDAKILGYLVSDDVEGYHRRMNEVFQLVEEELGCPVVIAASGKYHYPEDRFQGRLLIYGQTLPLIQNSNLVIGHCSGALDQVIVNRKPLLQLDDPSFQKVKRDGIRYCAQYLGSVPIRSDRRDLIREAIKGAACDASSAVKVEAKYFREPGVNGDYRELIKQAFLSI